jgi:hypothetical protein
MALETVQTARLLLARPRAADVEAIFWRYAADPDVTRYVGWPRHKTVDDTRGFLAFSDAQWDQWPAGPYLAWSRSDGALLGSTGLMFDVVTLCAQDIANVTVPLQIRFVGHDLVQRPIGVGHVVVHPRLDIEANRLARFGEVYWRGLVWFGCVGFGRSKGAGLR